MDVGWVDKMMKNGRFFFGKPRGNHETWGVCVFNGGIK